MARRRSWTDEQLREAVATSETLVEVLAKLGLSRGGGSLEAVRKRLVVLGVNSPHERWRQRSQVWDADPSALYSAEPQGRRSWSDQDLARAVAASRSIAGVLRELNLAVGGWTYVVIKGRIAELGLDTSHFTGQGWSKGLSNPTGVRPRPLDAILIKGSPALRTSHIRERLLREGLKAHRCETCDLSEWRGNPIPLQLDHVNGDRTDNRFFNLRLLCPNCHAQTDTWCGKNVGRGGP